MSFLIAICEGRWCISFSSVCALNEARPAVASAKVYRSGHRRQLNVSEQKQKARKNLPTSCASVYLFLSFNIKQSFMIMNGRSTSAGCESIFFCLESPFWESGMRESFQFIAPFGGDTRNVCQFQPKHFLLDGATERREKFSLIRSKNQSVVITSLLCFSRHNCEVKKIFLARVGGSCNKFRALCVYFSC